MTPQQIIGLAVRLFSIWLFIFAFELNGYISAVNHQSGSESVSIQYPLVGFVFILSLVLWFFPLSVAHKLIPKTQYNNNLNVPAQEAVHVACIVFALWLLFVKLLPAFSYYIPLAIYISHNHQSTNEYEQFHFLKIAPVAVEFLFAVIFTFKSRAISKYLIDLGENPSK